MELTLNAQSSSGTSCDCLAFSLSLSSELSALINEHETGKVQIEFQSDEKGTIIVNGEVMFDIVISDSKLMEPYKLNAERNELTNFGQVLGRCTTTSRSISGNKNSSSTIRSNDGAANAATAQRSANRIDMLTVKLASSNDVNTNLLSQGQPLKRGAIVMQPADTKQSALKKSEREAQKKKPQKRVGRSCVAVLALPLKSTVGQIDQFMSGLSPAEMFSFPYQLRLSESSDGSISLEGMADIYVVFNSEVSGALAEKRSGETLFTPSAVKDSSASSSSKGKAVKPVVKIVTEDDLLWPRGLGVRLPLCNKNSSTSSKLESILKYSQSIFRNQQDKDTFQHFLLQDCMKTSLRVQKELDGIEWRKEVVFNPMGPDAPTAAASVTHRNKKRKTQHVGIDIDMKSMYAASEVVPMQWNPALICDNLLSSIVDSADASLLQNSSESIIDAAEILKRVQHLQSVFIIANTRIHNEIGSSCASHKQEGDIADYLNRMHMLFSTVNCLLWRKSVM